MITSPKIRCSICRYVEIELASIDVSCQAYVRCFKHPEWGRFPLYGRGCDNGMGAI